MRITYDTWHEHFEETPTVFLNGMVVKDLIEAGEEAGHVVVYDTDVHGNYIYDAGAARRRKITGRVSIEGKPKATKVEPAAEIDYTQFCGF